MRTVLIDTSLLLDCVRHKLDLFGELGALMDEGFETVVSEGVVRELRNKAASKGLKGMDARVALSLLSRVTRTEPDNGLVDEWLLKRAGELNAIICTDDSELRRRAKAARLQVVSLMHGSRLGFA